MVRSPTRLPTFDRVGIEQGHDPEAAGAEAAVVGERLAEVPDADDGDRPVVGEAELTRDLVEQVLDVVAHAAGAVGAEEREVLADLGRVDARQLRQPLRGDRADLGVSRLEERPVVERQAGDRRLRDASSVGNGSLLEPAGERMRPRRSRSGYRPCAQILEAGVGRATRRGKSSRSVAVLAQAVLGHRRSGRASVPRGKLEDDPARECGRRGHRFTGVHEASQPAPSPPALVPDLSLPELRVRRQGPRSQDELGDRSAEDEGEEHDDRDGRARPHGVVPVGRTGMRGGAPPAPSGTTVTGLPARRPSAAAADSRS